MTNPFDDKNGSYQVFINAERQYSLWPTYIDIPVGWTIALQATSRQARRDYINENWVDMRPKSLIDAVGNKP